MRTHIKFMIFCIVGATGALIELLSFNLFFIFITFPLSKLFAIILALIFNFNVNRNYTFLASSGKIKKQLPKYVLIYSMAFLVNFGVSLIVQEVLPAGVLNANIAAASGIVIAIPISFLGSLLWIFR